MAKVALLIGVSEYQPGLDPLPSAVKDVEALQKVLQHPDIGSFAEVKMLPNPERQAMEEAIETLFAGRQKDDLVLLFFSGHGIKDESGTLYLATRTTRKNTQGELVKATAVSARFVQDIMSNSRSKRQVVILDCCFSGAFAEGWLAKDDGSVDVKTQLGGEGRVVLTSSTSTQYSFEQQGTDLSIYTRYLVKGIESGAADRDSDGIVSVDELHEYARIKVQEAAPAMKPEIYAVKEGFKIRLAKAPIEDPRLIYRKEVENLVENSSQGAISFIGRKILDAKRVELKLPARETEAIEAEVFKPFREYQQKLQQYEQAFVEAIQHEYPLSNGTRKELKHFQQVFALRDEDITPIESRIAAQKKSISHRSKTSDSLETPTISRSKNVRAAKLPEETVVAKFEPPALNEIRSSSLPDFRLLGILKRLSVVVGIPVAIVFLWMGLQPQIPEPSTPDASPTVSPTSVPIEAKNLFNRGSGKFDKGNYKEAIADYSEAIRYYPNYVEAYQNRGVARYILEDYKGAIEDYQKAASLDLQKQGKTVDQQNMSDYLNELHEKAMQSIRKIKA